VERGKTIRCETENEKLVDDRKVILRPEKTSVERFDLLTSRSLNLKIDWIETKN